MKIRILNVVVVLAILLFASCSGYLDADIMDDKKTIDQVFKSEVDALGALAEVYSYIQSEADWANSSPWTGISDELRVTFTGANGEIHEVNIGSMKASSPYFNKWNSYYRGIRNATYFILNVDKINYWRTNEEFIESRRERYRYEARALRAYYYFNLFKQYGPLVILPTDYLIESDASIDEMSIPRSSVAETVQFIVNELDACINSGKLPRGRKEQYESDYGRMNVTTCMAIKSRVLLYAASDFYNADRTLAEYANLKNKDGKKLFDYTNEGRIERWQKAAQAAKDIIDLNVFSLFRLTGYSNSNLNSYHSYRQAFHTDWNIENIFARKDGGWNYHERCVTPQNLNVGCYGAFGPTQQMVDAYFTKNGLLIDEDTEYTETGFTSSANTDYEYGAQTFNMYANREPRFYASVAFDNARWISTQWNNIVRFYYGGNAGLKEGGSRRNVSLTGYLAIKFLSESYNGQTSPANSASRNYIYFRYAEILLNYVESLNEIDFNANKTEIFKYINDIRDRAGIPLYGNEVGQIPIADAEHMRKLIRAERRVELAFEGHRYFDCKRWIIAHETDGGQFFGMNVYKGKNEGFFERYNFETRSFQTKNYLWPIHVNETYKNKHLVQNPGW